VEDARALLQRGRRQPIERLLVIIIDRTRIDRGEDVEPPTPFSRWRRSVSMKSTSPSASARCRSASARAVNAVFVNKAIATTAIAESSVIAITARIRR